MKKTLDIPKFHLPRFHPFPSPVPVLPLLRSARSPPVSSRGCTVIPWMFDTAAFAEKAATIAKEKADALAKQELEELQVPGGCWMMLGDVL